MEFGLSGAFVETPNGTSTVDFAWFNSGTPFLPESAETCQHNFDSFPATGNAHARSDIVRRLHSAIRLHASAADEVDQDRSLSQLSPIAKISLSRHSYGLGAGVGRGLGDCAGLGVGVGRGVGVVVAVGVALAVAVAVAVGVAVAVAVAVPSLWPSPLPLP